MSIGSIVNYVNLGLVVLFVLIIVGFLIAGLRGFLRGVWKSTHNMIFMLSLFLIAFITLNALTDFVGTFPLSTFIKGSYCISREIDGEIVTYYVPITNVKETLTEFVKGFYTLYNVSASPSSAVDFSLALAYSILKIAVVLIDVILIMLLGTPACLLSWLLIFRHFVPRVARKKAKLRWIGLAETMVTFLLVTFMFLTPFTSIVNSVNQTYQKSQLKQDIDEQDEMVQTIGSFADAYNNSPFAKVFFNWTVDNNGMTYDTRLFNSLTTGVSGDYSIGVIKEIVSLTNAAATGSGALSFKDGEVVIDATQLISKEIVDKAFDAIINSSLMQTVFPLIVEVAMNSDLLAEFIPNRLVDLSDVKWEEEIGYVRDMVDCIFDSEVVSSLFVEEDGKRVIRSFEGESLVSFIEEVVYSENFNEILNIFKKIDESKILSRAVPALLYYLINNDEEGVVGQYLPFSWEELNEFSWGYETYVLFDFLHSTAELDDKMLKAIFIQTGLYSVDDPSEYNLATLISEHADAFKSLVVGKFDTHGELENVDSRGQTQVFDSNGKRIAGRNYCLFDMNLIGKVLPTLLDQIFDLEALSELRSTISDEDLVPFHQAVASLNNNNRLVNYKKEFNAVLDVVATLAKDTELLDALISGAGFESLMAEEGNFFSIDASHITHFKNAINKMDQSTVLYSALTPMLKSLLSGDDVANTFNDIGLKSSVLVSAIDQDMKKANHTLFSDFSSLLDSWGDLNNIYSLSSIGDDTNALMDKLKQDDVIDSFKNILKVLIDNPLINPDPQPGDDFEKNENLYGLLEFVFSMTSDLGLTVTRDTLRHVESGTHTWENEIDAFGNILQFIAKHNLMNASSDLENGLTRTAIDKLTGHGDDDYYIRGLFDQIETSYIFKTTLGPFLDDLFGDSLSGFLIDTNYHISFSNITDWAAEGLSIENLLKSLHNITPVDDNEAKDFLEHFDISTLDKIVDLNAMLHDLAHSGIFTYIDENGTAHYQFGKWLFNKIDASLGSFTVNGNPYDLLADPKFSTDSVVSWDKTNWGIRPEDEGNPDSYYLAWKNEYNPDGTKEDTHYIAYKDFVYINGMADTDENVIKFWCDYDEFVNAQTAFLGGEYGNEYQAPASYLDNDWSAYYGSDAFVAAYDSVFAIDEISRVTKFMCYAMRILQPRTDSTTILFDEIPKSLLDGLLTSLNETHCMRAGIYNFYRIASDSVFSSYAGFSLSSAYITYMIDGDAPLFDFDNGRPARQAELDKLVNLYDLINIAKDNGVFSGGNFVFENMRQNNFLITLEATLKDMNDSYVFHRKGSSKDGQLTTFQSLFDSMLSQSDIGNSIYLGPSKSPKDANNTSLYSSAETKVKYLVTSVFPDDNHNPNPDPLTRRDSQKSEVKKLMDVIDELYSLKDKTNQTATSISNADLSNDDNIDAIWRALGILNESNLLRDLVPNTIYKLFIDDAQFSITCGTESVDFTHIDPFYHYYYNVNTLAQLSTPNFDAKYSEGDINAIRQLLIDYDTFNTALGTNEITNVDTLKILTGHVDTDGFHSSGALSDLLYIFHAKPIFHTPARNYDGMYYTNKFQSGGYTLFEELMSKICTFTGLDDFAFDSTYDSEASASIKLHNRIKAITAADDGLGAGVCYHTGAYSAWTNEIHSIMEIAYRVADMSSGSTIDINNFALESLAPENVKTILTCLNCSDLVGDSIPGFVKNGFEAINLGTLTSYDAVNYANYRIGQVGYGGANGLSEAGSEIDNIYNVLVALHDGTNYVTNVSNISDFIGADTTGSRLTGLLGYIYDSRILNTPAGQEFRTYKTVSGHKISAQGVLLYNTLNNSGLSGFIARDALTTTADSSALDRIQQLSIIIHMPYEDADAIADGLTYAIEAQGLSNMINITNTSNINADTFTGAGNESINKVKSYKTPILNIVANSYNADGLNHRSALVSELVSGLLNNVLENEYNSLSGKAGYAYNEFSFGKPDGVSDVRFSHYSTLNETEKRGLEGILNSLDYVGQLSPSSIPVTDEERKALADNLEGCFALMTTEINTVKYNSEIAKIVYLNNVHSYFKTITQNTMHSDHTVFDAELVDETSVSTLPDTKTLYSSNFFLSEYGTAFKDYLYPGVTLRF